MVGYHQKFYVKKIMIVKIYGRILRISHEIYTKLWKTSTTIIHCFFFLFWEVCFSSHFFSIFRDEGAHWSKTLYSSPKTSFSTCLDHIWHILFPYSPKKKEEEIHRSEENFHLWTLDRLKEKWKLINLSSNEMIFIHNTVKYTFK